MSTPPRPVEPRRWIRTLPWLAGLLLGTSAHIVWWTSTREPAATVVRVVTVPAPPADVHVHLHSAKARPLPHHGVRGAVVCSAHGCTIRRSFLERLRRDPSLLAPAAQVQSMALRQRELPPTLRFEVIEG